MAPMREDWTDNQTLVASDHIAHHNALAAQANTAPSAEPAWFTVPLVPLLLENAAQEYMAWDTASTTGEGEFWDWDAFDPTVFYFTEAGVYAPSIEVGVSQPPASVGRLIITATCDSDGGYWGAATFDKKAQILHSNLSGSFPNQVVTFPASYVTADSAMYFKAEYEVSTPVTIDSALLHVVRLA